MAMPDIRQRLAKLNVNTTEDLLSFFYLDSDAVTRFIEGVKELNSDNYPVLEFSAPKYLLERDNPDIFLALLNRSYGCKLPLANVQGNIAEIQEKRMNSRVNYFRQFGFPETVIRQMLDQG